MASRVPKCILLFSGKRKSGKDYLTDRLYEKLGPQKAAIIRISAPIKKYWADKNKLQYDELLSCGPAKEQHREAMIKWSEDVRKKDPGIFCDAAVNMADAQEKSIWIVSDIRRKTDIEHFVSKYGGNIVRTVRVYASDETRKSRGWIFTAGVDDKESECDLDDVTNWDISFENNGQNDVEQFINSLIHLAEKMEEL